MLVNSVIIFFIFSSFFISICKKYNLFLDIKIEKHKKYTSSLKSYSIGGILLICFIIYYFSFLSKNDFLLLLFLIIFLIGLLSDLKVINRVSIRFLLQIISITFFVQILNIEINSTKFEFFDELLKNNIINILFVTFCLTVLINGANFTDGLNGLTINYHLIIYILLYVFFENFAIDREFISYIIPIIIILLIFNLLGFLYLGDSGSYLLSIMTGIFLINFAADNFFISPYFVILLLWYPCFELLFSMLRRFFNKMKTYQPDTYHLHQLIYKFLKKNINIKNNLLLHFCTSLTINIFNLISFLIAINYIYNSETLILILIINIFIYISLFNFLKKNNV